MLFRQSASRSPGQRVYFAHATALVVMEGFEPSTSALKSGGALTN